MWTGDQHGRDDVPELWKQSADRWGLLVEGTLVGVFVLAVFAGVFALVATDPGDNLVLVESSFRTGQSGNRFVAGSIRNYTDRSYAHAQGEINFLDQDGSVLGSTVANTNNLGGGETWNVEAAIRAEDAVRVRLENLTCRDRGGRKLRRACYLPSTLISLTEQG